MAVARMFKVTVIGYEGVADQVVDCLQRSGVLAITRADIVSEGVTSFRPDEHRLNELDEQIARAQFVKDFLGRYHEPKIAFKAFIAEKIHVAEDEFDALEPDAAFDVLYDKCNRASARLAEIERDRAHSKTLLAELRPWAPLRLQISRWKGGERVALFTGVVPSSASAAIRQSLRDAVDEVTVAEVGHEGDREAWVVMAHTSCLAEVRAQLALTQFSEVSFPELEDYPAEEIANLEDHLLKLDAEEAALRERIADLEAQYLPTAALVEALRMRRDAVDIRADFAATERVFAISGWLPQRLKPHLIEALAPVGADVDISFAEPDPEDIVPVEIVNPWFIRPFEVLTDLYGRPAYGDVDPTPLLAGFFFLFFGMCIADVGYGASLAIAAYLMKTRLDVAPGVKKFMDLLIAGGIAAILVGVATRSYFALTAEQLPAFLRYEPLLDPLEDIITLLIVSIAIGVVHVMLGVAVNVYQQVKRGAWADAVQDDLSTVLLLVALAATFATGQAAILGWAALVAVVLKGRVIGKLFVERAPLKALLGVGSGILGIYGLTGFISDFLSYSRLAALGLSGLLVGQVMNLLAGMVSGAPWGIGLVAAVLILVVGHTFNLVINLLGSFVHPARLQFVEFFSKFYEAGVAVYKPFSRDRALLVLHPSRGEQEGGSSK